MEIASVGGTSERNSLVPGLNQAEATEKTNVELDTVDAYCQSGGIRRVDLLKTDTEGFDLEVLRGATRMLEAGRIGYVLCEVSFDRADRRHTNFFQVYEFLSGYGHHFLGLYHVIHEGGRFSFGNALFAPARWDEAADSCADPR
jgi:hypothetical protein